MKMYEISVPAGLSETLILCKPRVNVLERIVPEDHEVISVAIPKSLITAHEHMLNYILEQFEEGQEPDFTLFCADDSGRELTTISYPALDHPVQVYTTVDGYQYTLVVEEY